MEGTTPTPVRLGAASAIAGALALAASAWTSTTDQASVAVLAVLALALVAAVAAIVAVARTSDPFFAVSVASLLGAACIPLGFPTDPWRVATLAAVPVLLAAYAECFLTVRRAGRHAAARPGATHHPVAGAAIGTILVGSAAVLLHQAGRLAGPKLAKSLEMESVYGILSGAALILVPMLVALVAWRVVAGRRRGHEQVGASSWVVVAVLAIVVAAGHLSIPGVEAQGGGVDVEITAIELDPPLVNATVTVNVTVANRGPSDATFVVVEMTLDEGPLRTDGGSNSLVFTDIPAGTNRTQGVAWRPSAQQAGPRVIAAQIVATGPTDSDASNDARTRNVLVRHARFDVALAEGEDTKEARPGEMIAYRLRLTNAGNFRDRPILAVEGGNESLGTWLPDPPGAMDAGEVRDLVVLVRPTASAPDSNAVPTGAINASSATCKAARRPVDPGCATALAELPATAVSRSGSDERYDVQFSAADHWFVDPNSTAVLEIQVINNGTTEDVVNLTVEIADSTGGPWNATLGREVLHLRTGEVVGLELTVQPPPFAGVGDALHLRLTGTSVHPPRVSPIVNVLDRTVRVSGPDLAVGEPVTTTAVYNGHETGVEVLVTNAGNRPSGDEHLNVSYIDTIGRRHEIGVADVPALPPGESVRVGVPWRPASSPGEHVVLASLDPAGPDGDVANNAASSPVVVRLARLSVIVPAGLEGSGGERVPYTTPPNVFIVRNEGIAAERVNVRITSEHGWLDTTSVIDVPPQGERRVPAVLEVPSMPRTLSDALRLTATLADLPSYSVSNETVTTILDSRPPSFERVLVPTRAPLDRPFNLTVHLDDDTGIARVQAEVTLPDGLIATRALEQTDAGVFSVRLRYATAGNYSVRFEAHDLAPGGGNVARSDEHAFAVVHLARPEVELESPANGSVIASGTPVQLIVSSDAPLSRVEATFAGKTTTLSAPHTINTTGWPQGTHDVVVRAEDIFGNAANASYRFTIDNRLPTISSFTAEKVETTENGVTYRFRLEATGGARADLIVRAPGAADEWIPFEGGPGVFTLRAPLPPDDVQVFARVESATGLAIASDPMELGGDGPGRGTPWPGAATTLVLAGLAFARRRRRH